MSRETPAGNLFARRGLWEAAVIAYGRTALGGRRKQRVQELLTCLGPDAERCGELSKRDELIEELKREVEELAETLENSEGGAAATAAAQNVTSGVITATKLGEQVYANVHCRKCNSYTGMLVGSDVCPGCGTPLS